MEYEKAQKLEQAKQSIWETGNECLELLLEDGSERYFFKKFPNLKLAFVKEMTAVVCIDEGCAHKDYKGRGKLTLAGAGILFPARSEDERIKIIAKLFYEMGIKAITSHEGCGAVSLAYQRDFPGSKVSKEELEAYGKAWTRKIIEAGAHLEHEVNAEHIVARDMERPSEFHTARVVYFDGIGGFNPDKEIGLPMGFVISQRFLPWQYAAEELKVAVNIAFGQHGFGDRFTADSPLIVIPLTENDKQLANLKKAIEEVLRENKNYQENKIKIDGFVVGVQDTNKIN